MPSRTRGTGRMPAATSCKVMDRWNPQPRKSALLVAQRIDWVQVGGFPGWIGAEEDSYKGTDQEAQCHPVDRQHWRQFEEIRGSVSTQHAQQHADAAAELAEHDRLEDELREDIAFFCSDGSADADLPC